MIKDQFLYFARYPRKEGVLAIFTNGASHTPGYGDIVRELRELPEDSRIPELDNYVYGQSFEDVQQRIDKLIGSYLFVDYGEINLRSDGRNSYQCVQRIAVTIACKMPNRADAAERMLASDNTLRLLARLHAHLLADADAGSIGWLARSELDKAEIIPFVATELHSVGWTLMLSCIAPDTLGTHHLYRSFANQAP
ncbi:hypothetical protein [Prevotella sp. HUN102]|uniref:hypothetical protein n=1 Tax=Prevotella sp. HUN102 TaxID=1392486 RepID=UPI0004918F0E|nr:hypothetical protein [Prevotella sp. HUN102]